MIKKKREDLKILKGYIKTNTYPPYSLAKTHNKIDRLYYNCYAYIWGLDDEQISTLKKSEIFQLGFSVNHNFSTIFGFRVNSTQDLQTLLFSDMKALGVDIKVSNESEEVNQDEWKIALYYNERDFHFIRQNNDKSWSGKNGFGGFVEIMEDGPLKTIETSSNSVYYLVNIYKLNISKLKQEVKDNQKDKKELSKDSLKEISLKEK